MHGVLDAAVKFLVMRIDRSRCSKEHRIDALVEQREHRAFGAPEVFGRDPAVRNMAVLRLDALHGFLGQPAIAGFMGDLAAANALVIVVNISLVGQFCRDRSHATLTGREYEIAVVEMQGFARRHPDDVTCSVFFGIRNAVNIHIVPIDVDEHVGREFFELVEPVRVQENDASVRSEQGTDRPRDVLLDLHREVVEVNNAHVLGHDQVRNVNSDLAFRFHILVLVN